MADRNSITGKIDEVISNLDKNEFNIYFFVVDSKNIPNGGVAYTYQLAYELLNEGYNVTMLYQLPNEYTDDEIAELARKEKPIDESRVFTGVVGWLGEKYDKLPHLNISTNEWTISPSDFLFIPEVFSSLMFETFKHNVPCKRYVLLHNYNYVTEFIPLGVQWSNYGISDALCVTDKEAELAKSVFPYLKTKVLNPYVDEKFRTPIKPKKLVINVIAKDQKNVNKIVKPFYWKYPVYNFVSFRDLRNFPQDEYAELLKEGAITVWIDDDTPFGMSALEAIRCGNVLIGKLPDSVPEWMTDDNGDLRYNGIWFTDINDAHQLIAQVVGTWMRDSLPQIMIDGMEQTNKLYGYDEWRKKVGNVFNDIINDRIDELTGLKNSAGIKRDNRQ